MRNEYILDFVDKILNLNDIHANRKNFLKFFSLCLFFQV